MTNVSLGSVRKQNLKLDQSSKSDRRLSRPVPAEISTRTPATNWSGGNAFAASINLLPSLAAYYSACVPNASLMIDFVCLRRRRRCYRPSSACWRLLDRVTLVSFLDESSSTEAAATTTSSRAQEIKIFVQRAMKNFCVSYWNKSIRGSRSTIIELA